MNRETSKAKGRPGGILAPSDPRTPDLMTAARRLREVASLLAAGFLRHWGRKGSDSGDTGLDFLRPSSDQCPEPTSEGETL